MAPAKLPAHFDELKPQIKTAECIEMCTGTGMQYCDREHERAKHMHSLLLLRYVLKECARAHIGTNSVTT